MYPEESGFGLLCFLFFTALFELDGSKITFLFRFFSW